MNRARNASVQYFSIFRICRTFTVRFCLVKPNACVKFILKLLLWRDRHYVPYYYAIFFVILDYFFNNFPFFFLSLRTLFLNWTLKVSENDFKDSLLFLHYVFLTVDFDLYALTSKYKRHRNGSHVVMVEVWVVFVEKNAFFEFRESTPDVAIALNSQHLEVNRIAIWN